MKVHFWSLIRANFIQVHGYYLSFASFLFGIFFWYFSDDKSIFVILFVLLLIITSIVITVLISSVMQLIRTQMYLPKIIRVIKESNEPICLLESSELFSNGIGVSFYYTNELYEQLICIGNVINIQENKLIQIKIQKYQEYHTDIIERLKNNDRQILDNIKVKPTVPIDIDFIS